MHLLNLARVLKLLVLALTCPWSKVGQICLALHRSKWFASPGPAVLRGECCRIPRVSSCQRHHCCEFVVSFQHKKGKRCVLILLFWFDSRLFLARSDVWWRITYRAQCRCREASTEGGSSTEERLPIHSADCDFLKDSIIYSITSFLRFLRIFVSSFHLSFQDPKLRDDAVVSSLMEWQHVPTLKLLKINGLKGDRCEKYDGQKGVQFGYKDYI